VAVDSKARNGRARGDGAVCFVVDTSGVCELADVALVALGGSYSWRDETFVEAICAAMLRVGETG